MSEREMNKHQLGIIDGCFEEGHYQRGIASLNQLRIQHLRPSPAHIRQLIYISLYPPPISKNPTDGNGKRTEASFVSGSPSKQIQQARRLQKQALFPPPEATQAAIELLHQFAIDSVSPEALMRPVPCYPPTQALLENAPRKIKADMFFGNVEAVEDMDSYISKQASELKECKDCWSMLRYGVVKRQDVAALRSEDSFLEGDVEEENDESDVSGSIVGKHSWHLLEWFVLLFEKDEALVVDSGRAVEDCYSLLFLSQIKPPSRSSDPRSDIDSVIDIVLLCYDQEEQWRRRLGRRLMVLLVSLTRCRDFSPLRLFTAFGIRLHASPTNIVTTFLSDLPITTEGLTVKLAICDRFLTHSLRTAVPNGESVTRARPQARRARPVSVHVDGDMGSPSGSQGAVLIQDSHSNWILPSSRRTLEILEPQSPVRTILSGLLSNLIVLFHLLAAFGTLRDGEERTTDPPWRDAILTGELERRICVIYADAELSDDDRKVIRPLRLLLLNKCTSWKQAFT